MTPEEIAAAEAAKNATQTEGQTEEKKITLTEKELQAREDKRVQDALKTREENLRKETEEKVRKEYEAKAEEDKRKAKMTADERAAAERKELEGKYEKAVNEKVALEKKIERDGFVSKVITEKKLDSILSGHLKGDTIEELSKSADEFGLIIQDAVKAVYGEGAETRRPGETKTTKTTPIDTKGMSVKEALRNCPTKEE